jgi:aminotransferase
VLYEDKFKLKADILKQYITPKTKLLILSYPCNPTGATMDFDDLLKISEVVKENNIVVVSDEIYSELTYDKKHASIASIEGMKDRTIVINGFSKSYSMTGWRLGYIASPSEVMKHIVKVHQYNVSCAPSISQFAGIEALKNSDSSIKAMVKEYDKRRSYCYNRLLDMGLKCFEPTGAFYIFPEIKKFGLSSEDFCKKLLYEGKLAVVPGSAFGKFGEGYIRISYAYSMDVLKDGLDRLETFLKNMQ